MLFNQMVNFKKGSKSDEIFLLYIIEISFY